MFCSCFVLSFDACIVTITWSLLFIVIALSVICLIQYITLAPRSSSGLSLLVCFLLFDRLTRKHLALLVDMVSGFKYFSEAPCLARKCDTIVVTVMLGLCNPPRRGHGEPAKPRLLYPLVWIPCCDTVT
jgi:hypothetical protein